MDLKEYLSPLVRWWWLLVAATLVAAVFSYFGVRQQPVMFQARTTLMIGRAIEDPNPTTGQFSLAQQLAPTYADIANREPVRNAAMENLGLSWLPEYKARVIPNSQLIEITVVDTNPARAQAVANELAHQLILRSPTSAEASDQARTDFVEQELDDLQARITETRNEILQKQQELGQKDSAREISDLRGEINALESKLTTLTSNYASLLANSQRGAQNTITVIEPAALPRRPITSNNNLMVLMASAVGLVLASGAAYLLEYLDKTVRTPEDVARYLQAPIIGYIAEVDKEEGEWAYVAKHPRSPVAEAFRYLRANLDFVSRDQALKTIFVASTEMGEGKTTVASNLALTVAQGEKTVILVDADLRRPSIHQFLGIPKQPGLSDVLQGKTEIADALRTWNDKPVMVITAGEAQHNPVELLNSSRMHQTFSVLEEAADMVIVDGPPFFVTDAAILASKVDGVLLVIRPGHTRKDALQALTTQVERSGTNIIGIVLNQISRRDAGYYGGYYSKYLYYSENPYFEDPKQKQPASNKKKGSVRGQTRRAPK